MSFKFDCCDAAFPCSISNHCLHVTITPDYELNISIDYDGNIPKQHTGFSGSTVSFCLETERGIVVGYKDGTWVEYRLSDCFVLNRGKWDKPNVLIKAGELHTELTDCTVYVFRTRPELGLPAKGTKLAMFEEKLPIECIESNTRPTASDGNNKLIISFEDGSSRNYYLTTKWIGIPTTISRYAL